MQKVAQGSLVIELDENGTEQFYDSSLYMAMLLTVRRPFIFALVLRVCESVLDTTMSIVTKKLISHIASSYAWHNANDMARSSLSKPASLGHGLGLAIGLASMQQNLIPTLAAVLTFITYSLSGHKLDTATIFASLQLFNLIQGPLRQLPVTFTKLTDAYVALNRITSILVAEEQPETVTILESAEFAIEAVGDFAFETCAPPDQNHRGTARDDDMPTEEGTQVEQDPFCLKDIDLRIRHGAFVCIFGRIGTGKSALLQGLIGEMRQTRGHVRFGGNIGLVTQNAWIQNASLKENILFGQEMDTSKLQSVLQACALVQLVKAFSDGIDTEIGERGINLSGGQRSRVALARAAYFGADVILLDDPLSAVDSHVSSHLVEQCFLGVLKDKTRVLVTHHLDVAKHADLIIVMDNGRVVQQGSYPDLASMPGIFQILMQEHGNLNEAPENDLQNSCQDDPGHNSTLAPAENAVSKLHIDEERAKGAVSWAVYIGYLKGLKIGGHVFIALVSLILGQCAQVGTTLFLGFWAGRSIPGYQDGDYMGLYAGFGVGTAIFIFLLHYHLTMAGVRAGFLMFQTAIHHVLRSSVTFHDRTPSGRIVSRLTKDMSTVDDNLGSLWSFFLSQFLSIFGAIALIAYAYPYLVIGFIPLGILYIIFALIYRHSFRELNRIASVTRSFVFQNFGEQVTGVSSIRAFQQQKYFLKRMSEAIDYESRFIYSAIVANRWFASRLDMLGSLLVLGVGVFGVCLRNSVSPTKFAVAFTYTLQTTYLLCELSQRGVWLEMGALLLLI
ncbi:hypothetical protein QFC22_006650 [Naganishia vaughanmartiniae]|uniref:Uncharacterized protein n=1 Tax=Naganishia vaughanmartiniae TaxID=1424756 RepID=A0ACC2WI32_9TREE|nr:hypothetical protein QFC22_006650 [Naganishia vaughanmartiniae]